MECNACRNSCGRVAAAGYAACCHTCDSTGGKQHGPKCELSSHHMASLKSLDAGKDLESRFDFAPITDQNADVNFEGNKQWMARCLKLVQTQECFKSILDICGQPPVGLVEYVRGLTPVHRMNETIFQAVLRDGGLRSRALQQRVRKAGPASAAAARLRTHPNLGLLARKLGLRLRDTHLLMDAAMPMLELELTKIDDKMKTEKQQLRDQRCRLLRDKINAKDMIGDGIGVLESLVKDVAEYTRSAGDKDFGVGYAKDSELGTDKHVFSIVGANMRDSYGDFVAILHPRIMQHPDFNMTVTAATSYLSKRTYFHRPWMALGKVVNYVPTDSGMHSGPDEAPGEVRAMGADEVLDTVKVLRDGEEVPLTDTELLDHYKKAKLHPSAVDWEHVVAMDLALQCRLFLMSKRKLDKWVDKHTESWRETFVEEKLGGSTPTVKDITVNVVKTWYTKINAHGCIECHLPEFVPLDYIDKLLMPSDRFEALKEELEKIVLGDGRTLSSCVVPIPHGGAYAKRVREWQEKYFDDRGRESFTKCGIGANIDMRAFSFGVQGLKGKEAFLPMRFLNPEIGFLVKFRVKGQHIRITFANRREETRDKAADGNLHVYTVCIGLFQNTVTYIKRSNKSGVPTSAEVKRNERSEAMAFPDRFRQYWINFNAQTGRLQLGWGGPDEARLVSSVMLEWTDPHPHKDIHYMAVGCWDTPLDFAMLKCSECMKTAS